MLAVLAALCYALGAALQQREAAATESLGSAARRPLWHLGLVLNAVGFALQAAALGYGELSLVQPLLVTAVLFSVPLAAWLGHRRPQRWEWGGAMAVCVGLVLYLLAARPTGLDVQAASAERWGGALLLVSGLVAALVLMARGSLKAVMMGAAAGIVFGVAAACTKSMVEAMRDGGPVLWSLVAVGCTTWGGFVAMQSAFRAGPLTQSWPALMALDPITGSLLGVYLFGEVVRGEMWPLAALGALLIIGGLLWSRPSTPPA